MSSQGTSSWRFRAGIALFVVGLACPLLIPTVVASDLSPSWKTALSGLFGVGIPDVFTIAAVAVMGKDGFNALKQRAFGLLRRMAPPDRVGPVRYRIGLVMFVAPIVFAWAGPYLRPLLPWLGAPSRVAAVAGDLVFVASFFVLGGDFWDKIRALFVQDTRAGSSARPAETTEEQSR